MKFQKTPIAILIAGAFMVGCGGSSTPEQVDPLSIEAYPLLQKYYGLDQDDLDRIGKLTSQLMAQKTTKQTLVQGVQGSQDDEFDNSIQSVKNVKLGAAFFIQNSKFRNFPIFDIGALSEANYVDINFKDMKDYASVDIKAKTTGNSESNTFKLRTAVSGKTLGWHASAAFEYDKNFQEINNKGGSSIVFRREVSSQLPSITMLTQLSETAPLDYSRFLMGTALTPQQIADIIKSEKCKSSQGDPAGGYICHVKVEESIINLIPFENAYAQIQVINELIKKLDTLRDQRSAMSATDTRRADILNAMIGVRDGIRERIETFYATHGQAFVSALYTMADGIGIGTIQWEDTTGNESWRYGLSVGAGFSTFGGGLEGEVDVQNLYAKGWAESFKNIKVDATSNPMGFIDVSAWRTQITDVLTNIEKGKPSVPAVDTTKQPLVTLPSPAKLKEPFLPPKGTYKDIDEWLKAKEILNPQPKKKEEVVKIAAQKVDNDFFDQIRPPAKVLKSTMPVAEVAAEMLDYDALQMELDRFSKVNENLVRLKTGPTAPGSNLVSVDGHYVSGFKVTKYEDVLPQLRPNLIIEGETEQASEYYPNATRLRMLLSRVQDAALYIRFLSNMEDISGINSQMADKFDNFRKAFSQGAFLKLKMMTVAGEDVPSVFLESFIDEMVGNSAANKETNALYKSADNKDLYRYFREAILTPTAAKIWAEGSGGYIPFTFQGNTQSKGMTFVDVRGIKYNQGNVPEIDSALNISFSSPETNPMLLYRDRALYPGMKSPPLQSPWYPVFRYNGSNESTLLYVQFVGADKIIYGKQYVIVPTSQDLKPYEFKSLPINPSARLSPQMKALMSNPDNSFSKNEGTIFPVPGGYKGFSIKFPNSTPSSSVHERYQMLLMPVNQYTTQQRPVSQAPDNGYHALPWNEGLRSFSVPSSSDVPYLLNSSLQAVNACNSISFFDLCKYNGKLIALLPISKQSIRENFQTTFRWGNSDKLEEIIRQNDYDVVSSIKFTHMKDPSKK